MAEVMRSVPLGSRRIRSQREALRGALSCPDLAEVRADFRDHLRVFWQIHVNYASWGGEGRAPRGTTEPTRARACLLMGDVDEHTGERRPVSESTYKRCSRWWRARGYLAIVRPGWTTMLRARTLLEPDDHNERQVLVLCLPHPKKAVPPPPEPARQLTDPLPSSRREPGIAPHTRASELPPAGPAPLAAVPQSGSDELEAARALQERARLLARLSARHLRHLARPFWRAGWAPLDILYALDHEHGGRPHGYTADIRSPAGWIRARLAGWLGPDGHPLPSPSQQRAAARAADVAAQDARRREAAETAAAKSPDYAGHAARARANLLGRPRLQPG
jgi:hypothetical protein